MPIYVMEVDYFAGGWLEDTYTFEATATTREEAELDLRRQAQKMQDNFSDGGYMCGPVKFVPSRLVDNG